MGIRDKFEAWQCPGGNSECADCGSRYCTFCNPDCTSCHGIHISDPREPGPRLRYYAQNGEDVLFWNLFQKMTTPGYFVEIGALDGMRFSNTYLLERKGWSGICVEAHPDFIKDLIENRPNSVVIHAAVGRLDLDECDFHANWLGTCSTLDKGLESDFKARYHYCFDKFETKRVPMKKLSTILDENAAPSNFDLLSVDVEGGEMMVLDGMDFGSYSPRVIVMEALNPKLGRQISDRLWLHGYKRIRDLENNMIFTQESDSEARSVLTMSSPKSRKTHVRHPLHRRCDPPGDYDVDEDQ